MAKSLLDDDFIDDGFDVEDVKDSDKGKPGEEEVEVEIVDDTPPADKGRWTISENDPDPVLPNEEELRSYSADVKTRFGQLTARVHAERRAKDETARQLAELTAFAKAALEENNKLKGVLENGEKVLVGEHKGRLEGQMQAAKRSLSEAQEAGDMTGVAAATEQMSRLAAQLDRLSVHNAAPIPRANIDDFDRRFQQVKPQAEPNPRAQKWAAENTWFQRDVAMTSYALGLDRQLTQNEGIMPDQEAYWSRIDAEMSKRFPDRFKQTQQRRAVTVAGVTRGGPAPTRRVTLTETQVRLANRLGLTPKQYAEQIAAEKSSGDGMFTHTFGNK